MSQYVLITPAKNEELYIGKTIESVINQIKKPLIWVIINDHSSDSTEDVIKSYLKNNSYISYVNNTLPIEKGFASKVQAFNIGYSYVKSKKFDYIGNLDADTSFDQDYYKKVIELFEREQKLGIAGGRILDIKNGHWVHQQSSANSVAGAVQFFRRSCFEQIGGYMPLILGGIDTAAEIMARAKGWDVLTVNHLSVFHHKKMLTGSQNIFFARVKQGKSNYILGYHPLFQLVSCIYRITERPYLIAAIGYAIGFTSLWIKRANKKLSDETIQHLQKEQLDRIKKFFLGKK